MPTDNDKSKEVLRKFYEKWGGKINANLLPQPLKAFMELAEKENKGTRET